MARRLALALGKSLVVGKLHRLLERGVIVAGVIGHDHRRLVREFVDEVLAPQFGGILPHLPRADLDQPLDHEGRFRTPGAAIGVDRHRIGVDGIDLAIDLRDLVLARQQRGIEISRHRGRERRHIGAEIGDGLDAKTENLAVGIEGHLGVGDMIAPVGVGEERLRAVGHPFHRPPDALGRPQRHDLFGVNENLRAEAAADVGRDHAQLVLRRHADEGGDHQPRDVRILRGIPQRERAGAGVVLGDGGARLNRVGHQAVVDDVELGDVLGRLEGGIDGVGVAEVPLVDRVVRRDVMDLRRAWPAAPPPDRRRPAAPRNRL